MKKLLKITMIALSFAATFAQAQLPTMNVSKMDTSGLFSSTVSSVKECIYYCVDGISLYMIITPWGVKFYWTLNVSHNSPDLLMMTYNDIRESPWEEFDTYFSSAYANITEQIMQAITSLPLEVGGGREKHKGWGRHQSVAFKEAAAIGHPAAVIMKIFDQSGLKPDSRPTGWRDEREPCLTPGCLEHESGGLGNSIRQETGTGGTGNIDTSSWLTNFYNGGYMNTTPGMVNHFGGNMGNIESAANNEQLNTFMGELGGQLGIIAQLHGAKTGMRLFCPVNITPFMPYYLSGLDALQWRMGYPISDFKYSQYILNPLSGDSIGTTVKENDINIADQNLQLPFINQREHWGHMFPREGVLNHIWDSKRGTVTVARAAHIMIEDQSTRVRYKPNESNNGFGGWGKLFPVMGETTPGHESAACHKNVSNTGITINETGGYAWTFWRRYNCDLKTTGIHIATVKFPEPICITPKVPD